MNNSILFVFLGAGASLVSIYLIFFNNTQQKIKKDIESPSITISTITISLVFLLYCFRFCMMALIGILSQIEAIITLGVMFASVPIVSYIFIQKKTIIKKRGG